MIIQNLFYKKLIYNINNIIKNFFIKNENY